MIQQLVLNQCFLQDCLQLNLILANEEFCQMVEQKGREILFMVQYC